MQERILMCEPNFFEVSYVINPWMKGNIAHADRGLAQRQWSRLAECLGKVATVERMTGVDGVPDMVFTANAGVVLGRKCVLSRFRHVERQAEEPHFAHWFEEHGFEVLRLPEAVPFEGAGDALLDRALPLLWLGHGHRSDAACAPLLQDWLDIDVEPLRLVDDRFYHLDTCFCPLEGGYLMYCPAAFDAPSRARITARVPAALRIPVDEADAAAFACNAVNIGKDVFLNHASPELATSLRAHGFRVHLTPLGEFMKAGGAAKCLTLRLTEVAGAQVSVKAA
ncbi:MAG: nitrate reductase [Herminiimonas sp.]|nr:nitrate reductase [Herminiimonas sp.]